MPVSIGLGLSLASTVYGGIQSAQAKKAAQNNLNARPQYQALPEDDSQLNLAQAQANQGMGAGARQSLLNNSQGNTAALANATLMGGGDANAIGNLADKSQQGLNNAAIYDDEARQAHLGTLLSTYRQYAGQRQANADKEWQVNKYAPWADKQQLLSGQQQAGQNLFSTGLNTLGKSLMSYGGGDNSGADVQLSKTGTSMSGVPVSGGSQMQNTTPSMGMAPYYSWGQDNTPKDTGQW